MTDSPTVASESHGRGGRETSEIHSALEKMDELITELETISEVGGSVKGHMAQAEEQELQLTENIDSESMEVEGYTHAIMEIERQIVELKERLDTNRQLKSKSEETLVGLNMEKADTVRLIKAKSGRLEEVKSEFDAKKNQLYGQQNKLSKIIQKARKRRHSGPEEKSSPIGDGSDLQTTGLASLGDVHGWAPGLFNYLTERGFAEVSFCGFGWRGFTHELQFKWRLTNISFRSPPGLDDNPFRPNSPPTLFSGIHVVPPTGPTRRRLILIGDLIDRGDHSEVVVEAVRQLTARAPGGCFSLIGNHEGLVILDNYKRWEYNEKHFLHEEGIENRPYTASHDPLVTGEESLVEGMESNFRAIRGSVGALLLTQHFSLVQSLPLEEKSRLENLVMPTWKKAKINHKRIEKKVNKGGWDLYRAGAEFLDSLCEVADGDAMVIPGALVSWYENGTFLLHAEPNGIAEIDHMIDDRVAGIGSMKEPWKIGESEVCFQLAAMKKGQDEKLFITQGDGGGLLWARGKDKQSEVQRGVEIIQSIFPQLTNVVHGHTAQSSVSETEISTTSGIVRIHNIDESIGPNPRFNKNLGEEYNIGIIPEGWGD